MVKQVTQVNETNETLKFSQEEKELNYDNLPYINKPDSRTHISKINATAKVFQFDTVDIDKARVLEIGCAWGGNLIPMAVSLPESEFIGVDLSREQVRTAKNTLTNMNNPPQNIKIENISFTDLDVKKYGKFDYIIAHGIYSWITPKLQDALMEKCSELVSDKGIVYISYNTLPGWNMVKTVRDLLKFHTDRFKGIKDKAKHTEQIFKFISENTNENSPYGQFLTNEWEKMKDEKISYLFHEFLEDENNPCYFNDFMKKAKENGFSYLSDISLSSMFLGNLSENIQKNLSQIKSIVQQEQYMDFLKNRRFRATMLFKSGKSVINREIKLDNIKDLFFTTHLCFNKNNRPIDFKKTAEEFKFGSINSAKGGSFKLNNKNSAVLIASLANKHQIPLTYHEMLDGALTILDPDDSDKEEIKQKLEKVLSNGLPFWIIKGIVDIHAWDFEVAKNMPEKPKVSEVVLAQIKLNINYLTSILHKAANAGPTERFLLRFCDGTRTIDEIKKEVGKAVENGKIVMSDTKSKEVITDERLQHQQISAFVDNLLRVSLINGMFIKE